MSNYTEPKTNWDVVDSVLSLDLNRIEKNIKSLKDEGNEIKGNNIYSGKNTFSGNNNITGKTTLNGEIAFTDTTIFSGILKSNFIQGWGYIGIPARPALTAGNNIIIRSDGTVSLAVPPAWTTVKTMSLSDFFPESVINISFDHYAASGHDVDLRILVDGVAVWSISGRTDDDGYKTYTASNITITSGSIISFQAYVHISGSTATQYLKNNRIKVAENLNTITDWEKSVFAITL